MTYRVQITRHAGRQLKSLSKPIKRRIDNAILRLADEPRPPGCVKLHAKENAWRIRVGDYRVIYEIRDDTLIVLIIHVGHRRSVYR